MTPLSGAKAIRRKWTGAFQMRRLNCVNPPLVPLPTSPHRRLQDSMSPRRRLWKILQAKRMPQPQLQQVQQPQPPPRGRTLPCGTLPQRPRPSRRYDTPRTLLKVALKRSHPLQQPRPQQQKRVQTPRQALPLV